MGLLVHASLGHAIQRRRLLSSPRFGAPRQLVFPRARAPSCDGAFFSVDTGVSPAGSFASQESYVFPARSSRTCCGESRRLPFSPVRSTNEYCRALRRRRSYAKTVQKTTEILAREIPYSLRLTGQCARRGACTEVHFALAALEMHAYLWEPPVPNEVLVQFER